MPQTPEPLRTAAKLLDAFGQSTQAPGSPTKASLETFVHLDSEVRCLAHSLVPANLRGRVDPDSIVQDAWMKLRDFGPENVPYQGPGSLASYLRRIIRQVMIDHLRAEQAAKRGGPGVRVALSGTDTRPELAIPSVDPTPTSGARHSEIEEIVKRALDDTAWEVWHRRVEGQSFEEIAEHFGKTAASVRGIHHRARRVIAEELGDQGTSS